MFRFYEIRNLRFKCACSGQAWSQSGQNLSYHDHECLWYPSICSPSDKKCQTGHQEDHQTQSNSATDETLQKQDKPWAKVIQKMSKNKVRLWKNSLLGVDDIGDNTVDAVVVK